MAQIAYHGVPKNAYVVFVDALQSHYLTKGLVVPLEDQNPAGMKPILSTISSMSI